MATISCAAELDPKAVVFKLPDQINWGPVTPSGNQQTILFGHPTKPGLYGAMTKWLAGNHFRAFPSQRSVHHRAVRNMVGGQWT
ncbi:MAG: hypothetical protein WBX37_13315 [Pseudolabrys sp.]